MPINFVVVLTAICFILTSKVDAQSVTPTSQGEDKPVVIVVSGPSNQKFQLGEDQCTLSTCLSDVTRELGVGQRRAQQLNETAGDVSIDVTPPSFIRDSKCLHMSEKKDCDNFPFAPLAEEQLKNLSMLRIPFQLINPVKTSKDSAKTFKDECDCIIETEKDTPFGNSDKDILERHKFQKTGLDFANKLALFKEQYGFYESMTEQDWEKLGNTKTQIPKCEIDKAIQGAKSCYKGLNFEKSLEIFLGATGKPSSKKFPENLNQLLDSIEDVTINNKSYSRKKYDEVVKTFQTGLDESVVVDSLLTSMLTKDNREELFKDVKNRDDLILKIVEYKKKNKDEFKKEYKKKLKNTNTSLEAHELDEFLNQSDEKFEETIISGLVAFPLYDSIFTDNNLRSKLFSNFKNSFTQFERKFLKTDHTSNLPTLAGFLDWNGETINEGLIRSCDSIKAQFQEVFCSEPEKFISSKQEMASFLKENNIDFSKVNGAFGRYYCQLPSREAANSSRVSDFFICNNISTSTIRSIDKPINTDKHCGLPKILDINLDSAVGRDLASVMSNSNYNPDEAVLRDIFGENYTKYINPSSVASGEKVLKGPIDPAAANIDVPSSKQAPAVIPSFYPSASPQAVKNIEQNSAEQIEETQQSKAASARKELSEQFKDSDNPEIKQHIANLKDEQALKLQEELQRMREKYAIDLAGLRKQIDELNKEKQAEVDKKTHKIAEALREEADKTSRTKNDHSALPSNGGNHFSNQKPMPSSGQTNFGRGPSSTSFSKSDNSSTAVNLGNLQNTAQAAQILDARNVNLTYESKNKDQKKVGLMVLEVSDMITGNPIEMANRDLEKYLTQNETKLDAEKLSLITSSGVLYRFKGSKNEIIEKQILYSNIDPKVKTRIRLLMETKKIERKIKEASYAYLLNIIDQYGKR
jgi:hypothetical protein